MFLGRKRIMCKIVSYFIFFAKLYVFGINVLLHLEAKTKEPSKF